MNSIRLLNITKLFLTMVFLTAFPVRAETVAPKTLNNLVRELVNFNFSSPPKEDYLTKPFWSFSFERQKDGWIYISIDAVLNKSDRVWLTLADDLSEKPILGIDSSSQRNKPAETMRFVKAGRYKVRLWSKGKPKLNNITVRSIPEIIYFKLLFLQKYRPYDFVRIHEWDYLRENILENYNVVVSDDHKRYIPYITPWREKGGKWLAASWISWSSRVEDVYSKWGKPMENPLFDGILIDEFGGSPKYVERYPLWDKTMKMIRNNPNCRDKMLYGFTGSTYNSRRKALFDIFFESGYKCVPEAYFCEKPSEERAGRYLKKYFTDMFMKWRKGYPGIEDKMVICLSPSNIPPRCCWNTCPNVNFKVYVDKQFNYLSNHPAFKDLYGITFFYANYMDDEMLRWLGALIRHYLIEGNRQMLSKDPYILTHLKNPGFEEGAVSWELKEALSGSIKVIDTAELEFKKKRGWNAIPEGEKVLYTKRSAIRPNIISQKIRSLTLGRLYSLKVHNADFRNFKEKKRISITIQLKGVELLQNKSRDDVVTHIFPMMKEPAQKTKVCWNIHYRVFRARTDTAELVLSDWVSDIIAGGPIGQEIIWDFIEIEPYFGTEEDALKTKRLR